MTRRRRIRQIRPARFSDDQPGWTLSGELDQVDWIGPLLRLKRLRHTPAAARARLNPSRQEPTPQPAG